MESTTDYSIFKINPSNRDIDPLNLKKVIASIETRNLLPFRPITVNSKMEVIDGQHRLEAAKTLGVPIYYIVQKDAKIGDILLLHNAQKSWGLEDYLKYYVSQNYIEYVKLKQFLDKNKLTLRQGMGVLNASVKRQATSVRADSTQGKFPFKEGGFIFPNESEMMEVELRMLNINQIVELIDRKTIGKKTYLRSISFYRALAVFLCNKEVDFDLFLRKIPYKIDLFRPCTKVSQYIKIFIAVYNWKNHSPIRDDYDENAVIA